VEAKWLDFVSKFMVCERANKNKRIAESSHLDGHAVAWTTKVKVFGHRVAQGLEPGL
jgi:hypothetical protein